jgi:hypothetical protein
MPGGLAVAAAAARAGMGWTHPGERVAAAKASPLINMGMSFMMRLQVLPTLAVVAEVASKVEPNRHHARHIARRCGFVMDVGMDVGLVSGLSDLFLPQKRLDKDRLLAVRWLWNSLLHM